MHSLALTHPHTHVGVSLALIFCTCIYFPFVINCSHVVQNFSCRPFDNFVVCGKSSFFVLLIASSSHTTSAPPMSTRAQRTIVPSRCRMFFILCTQWPCMSPAGARPNHLVSPSPLVSPPSCAFCTIYETCALLVARYMQVCSGNEEQIRSRVDHCPRFRESHRSLPLRPFAA